MTKLQNLLDDIEGLWIGHACSHYESFDEMRRDINELVATQALVADDVRVYGVGITVHQEDGIRRLRPHDVIFKHPPDEPEGKSTDQSDGWLIHQNRHTEPTPDLSQGHVRLTRERGVELVPAEPGAHHCPTCQCPQMEKAGFTEPVTLNGWCTDCGGINEHYEHCISKRNAVNRGEERGG